MDLWNSILENDNILIFDINHQKYTIQIFKKYIPNYIKGFLNLSLLYVHYTNIDIYLNDINIRELIHIPNNTDYCISSFIEMYGENSINWFELSKNNSLTLELLKKYLLDGPLQCYDQQILTNIKLDINIFNFLSKNILVYFNMIYSNKSITEEICNISDLNYRDKEKVYSNIKLNEKNISTITGKSLQTQISKNKTLTPELIRKFPEKLDWNVLSLYCVYVRDPNFVDEFSSPVAPFSHWSYFSLSANPDLNVESFKKYIAMWNYTAMWNSISKFFPITLDIIKEFDKSTVTLSRETWNWNNLCENKFLTKEIIEFFIDRFDNLKLWDKLSKHNFDINTLKKFRSRWNWNILSEYQNLSVDKIKAFFPEWNWDLICKNKSLSSDIIKEWISIFNNKWELIIQNDSLNLQIIRDYPDKIDWHKIRVQAGIDDTNKKIILYDYKNNLNYFRDNELMKNKKLPGIPSEYIYHLEHPNEVNDFLIQNCVNISKKYTSEIYILSLNIYTIKDLNKIIYNFI
jgi:hypothetical protein